MPCMAKEVVCARCLSINRVPDARLADRPTCGRCGTALLSGAVADVGDAAFRKIVDRTQIPVIVDFWAPWCGPCRTMAPHLEQAAKALEGRAVLLKVNCDQSDEARRLGIQSIPTLVRFMAGRESGRVSGTIPAAQIVAFAGRGAA